MAEHTRVDLKPGEDVSVFAPSGLAGRINSGGRSGKWRAKGEYVPPVVTPPPDTTGPVITNTKADAITAHTAYVSCVLSEPGTCFFRYGTTPALGSVTPKEPGLLPSHRQQMIGLPANTQIYYAPVCADAKGNETFGAMQVFATLPEPVVPPVVTPGPPVGAIVATTNGMVIEGKTIKGKYAQGYGVTIKADDVILRRCELDLWSVGVFVMSAKRPIIEDCVITNTDRAGILTTTMLGGRVSRNLIQHVGDARTDLSGPLENNAYGIAFSNDPGQPVSSDLVCEDNVVEDVPLWHLFDTHNGSNITWRRNIGRRGARAMFLTGSSTREQHVYDNQFLEARTKAGGTNAGAVTLYMVKSADFVGNKYSGSYGQPMIYDYQGGSHWSEAGTILLPSGLGLLAASVHGADSSGRNDRDDADATPASLTSLLVS